MKIIEKILKMSLPKAEARARRLAGNGTVPILPPPSLMLSAWLLQDSLLSDGSFSLFSAHTREDCHCTISVFIFLFTEMSRTEEKPLRSNPRFLVESH